MQDRGNNIRDKEEKEKFHPESSVSAVYLL